MSRVLGDVIIPAYNEAAVIARCLRALLDGLDPAEVQIIVACNGCVDATADIARAAHPGIIVLESAEPSKTAAIRAAEELCGQRPRIYLDADVELPGAVARDVLRLLAAGTIAARPSARYETADSSWPVRSYYRARRQLPSVMHRLWGAGIYGLSAEGRARFDTFPDVVAEDLWVDRHFDDDEIVILQGSQVVVHAPRSVAGLRQVLRRAQRGVRTAEPQPQAPVRTTTGGTLRDLRTLAGHGPAETVDAAVYAMMSVLARSDLHAKRTRGWERDETSRVAS